MKKFIKTILLLFLLSPILLFSQSIKIDSAKFDVRWIASEDIYQNKIVILGCYGSDAPPFPCKIYEFDGEEWTALPNYCTKSGASVFPITEPLELNNYPQIHYDSTGNLWISGYRCMYQYKNSIWSKFFIDDTLQDYREYNYFTIDKNNFLWIETKGFYYPKRISFSELIKFTGKDFQSIKKYKTYGIFQNYGGGLCFSDQQRIVTLPDNRILLHRRLTKTIDESQENLKEDIGNLYYYNQDGTYKTELIQTASTPYLIPYYDTLNKHVFQIYPENENKIWFALGTLNFDTTFIDGGIVLHKDDNWIPFTETNGLKKLNSPYPTYESITKIIKLDAKQYMAFGEENIYKFSDDYQLEKISKDSILAYSRFIDASLSQFTSLESLEDYLLRPLSPYTTNITNVLLYKNKELWIFLQRGILVVDLQFITGIQEENLKNELIIYPNPTFTEININKLIAYSYYKIYNVYGTLVQEGTNLNNLINIQDLPTSIYFIEFYFNNQFLLSQKFIKL